MMRAPLRALRSSFCTTSLCGCGQYQPRAQLPAVDDVADQIDRVGIVIAQEVEQAFGLAAARAEMNIGNEESTEQTRAVLDCHDV